MKCEIFFFTGTGNSLAVARDIADKLKSGITAIHTLMDRERIATDADIVGIIFPVYNQGLPFIIKRFVEKLEVKDKYIFGVCTYGDSPGISLKYLDILLREREYKLSAGFAIQMPYNYVYPSLTLHGFTHSFRLREQPEARKQEMFTQWKTRIEGITKVIASRKEAKVESKADVLEHLIDALHLRETLQKSIWLKIGGFEGATELPFIECVQLMDHAFYCNSDCTGCGICARVCPVNNISLSEGSPQWQHHCEQCFACLQWCPKAAIQYSRRTTGQERYHHPEVQLSDLLIYK